MTVAYLVQLNLQQRRAAEHGVWITNDGLADPLLAIAGAGSGKTSTASPPRGACDRQRSRSTVHPPPDLFPARGGRDDPPFERISAQALGQKAAIMTKVLTWAGTFDGVGGRLLCEYADQIDLRDDQ